MKMFVIAALALTFSFSADAKMPGTKVSKPTTTERQYASSGSYSYGGSYTHEITTNLSRGFFQSGKECKNCESGTNLTLTGSYLRYWKDSIQWGAEGGLRMLSKEASGTGDSETLFDIMGIGAYNFQSDLKNAIYAKAGIGLMSVLKDDGSDYENKLSLFVGAGKRFAWFGNVSYSPELRLVKRGDIDLAIQIDIVNFSLYW